MNPQNLQTPQALTLESLAQAYNELNNKFTSAETEISILRNALNSTQAGPSNSALTDALTNASSRVRPRRPNSYNGKGSISSWITHMDNYLGETPSEQSLQIAVSYMEGAAHEWWIVYQQSLEGHLITTWPQLIPALRNRFDTLNKTKIARDKLARWKQVKDVATFNDDFLKIILDIPNISIDEQLDRYSRGLKPYIWKELCTRDYNNLTDAMRDAERVESAHRRLGPKSNGRSPIPQRNQGNGKHDGPTPMDIGNVQIKKLTPAERDLCRKEGRCFRCREKGHMASKCPKGRGN